MVFRKVHMGGKAITKWGDGMSSSQHGPNAHKKKDETSTAVLMILVVLAVGFLVSVVLLLIT